MTLFAVPCEGMNDTPRVRVVALVLLGLTLRLDGAPVPLVNGEAAVAPGIYLWSVFNDTQVEPLASGEITVDACQTSVSPSESPSDPPSESASQSPSESPSSSPSPTGGVEGGNPTSTPAGGTVPDTALGATSVPAWPFAMMFLVSLGGLLYLRLTTEPSRTR